MIEELSEEEKRIALELLTKNDVPVKEREKWYLMGGGVTWDSCSEVIHIEQILGNYQNYAHETETLSQP